MSERDLIEEIREKLTDIASTPFWMKDGFWPDASFPAHRDQEIYRRRQVAKDALATIARLSEALAEAEKKGVEVERMAEFARGIIRDSAWQGCDLDGADVQERALKAGLLRREEFDPAVHEDVEGYAEPGMDWFVFSGPLAPPLDLSQGGQHG